MLPRQSIACLGSTKKPIESIFTPNFSSGAIRSRPSTVSSTGRAPSIPNILGIEGPKISASNKPTLYPCLAKATARLDDTVDFPTPPLPDEMAMICFTFDKGFSPSAGLGSSFLNFKEILPLISTSSPTKVRIADSAAFTTDLMKGSFSFSKISEKVTLLPSMRILSSTISASIRFLPLPG